MAKPRGLGRGLASLIPDKGTADASSDTGIVEILISLIDPNPFQPRKHFSPAEIAELSQSIVAVGILQPILLRPVDSRYQLVAGERRVRAAQAAGLDRVPAVIRSVSDAESMEMALVENLQRRDLNPIEEATAYWRLSEELGWTQESIGSRVGKSRSHIANLVRLLGLTDAIRERIASGDLSVAHAKILLSVAEDRREGLAERAVAEGWTVKRLQWEAEQTAATKVATTRDTDVHLRAIEVSLRRNLGTRVVLRGNAGKGRIEIPYRSVEELERFLELLQGDRGSDPGFVV
ncbi:MAG: ParB/RepB/Spo0J family partition protein [Firmicutes bacterium]|jgi:ParB family chromosome partitioning protein|nr:ParB/RepB/Spo0J family partition protein [Bacillota bacterium]MCL5971487.1 ParB/RepB/Spo0J family partition protein [Bacillota bacterium]